MYNKSIILSIALLSLAGSLTAMDTAAPTDKASKSSLSKFIPSKLINYFKPKKLTNEELDKAGKIAGEVRELTEFIEGLERGIEYTHKILANDPDTIQSDENGNRFIPLTLDDVKGTEKRLAMTQAYKKVLKCGLAQREAELIPYLESVKEWGGRGIDNISDHEKALAEFTAHQPSYDKGALIVGGSTFVLVTVGCIYARYKNKQQIAQQAKVA